MINGRCRMVAGGVDGGRQPSSESLHADCHVLAVRADHRQVQDGDLDAVRVAAQGCAVPVQDVDLGLQRCLVRRQVAAVSLLCDDPAASAALRSRRR